jgi:antitoxin
MKYPYYIEYTESGFPILRLPEEIGLVTAFLISDIQGRLISQDFFLEEIDRVLKGEIPSSEVGGNMCILEIKKDFTTIINTLTDEEDNPENRCVIETEELKNLILVWHQFRRLDSKQRDTDTIHRVPASTTNQSLQGNELPNEVREA